MIDMTTEGWCAHDRERASCRHSATAVPEFWRDRPGEAIVVQPVE